MGSIEEIEKTLHQHPEPVYQKTYLLILSTEMLHRVMALADEAMERDWSLLVVICMRSRVSTYVRQVLAPATYSLPAQFLLKCRELAFPARTTAADLWILL
jgi:hypothetical protein